jgi:hypothetical protein
MLDIQECSNSEVQKHPDFGELSRVVSRNQTSASSLRSELRVEDSRVVSRISQYWQWFSL